MKLAIRIYFLLRLRVVVNGLQRLIKGEPFAKRADKLHAFHTPEDMEHYAMERFKWRKDGSRLNKTLFLPLDYITNPLVFQVKLDDGVGVDGDCDDLHAWYASVLQNMSGVSEALLVSVVWKGGGHTVCLYQRQGFWHLLNYKITGTWRMDEAQAIARTIEEVLEWKRAKDKLDELPKLRFCVAETLDHKLRAVIT